MTTDARVDDPPASAAQPHDAGSRREGRGFSAVLSWPMMLLGSLALAGVSLFLLPRNLAYDPWTWLIWGREIIHLDLNTRGAATAVKPLPIFINTFFALFGSRAEPILWLLSARAATVLAVALAFRLGARLGGIGAGAVAAIGLAGSDQFLGYLFMSGMSEPMATATMLAAVDSHLDGRRRTVYWWLVAAGLLRPEAWPFLVGYAVASAYPSLSRHGFAWRSALRQLLHPMLTVPRAAAIVLAIVVPPSWFVIDYFGARQFFRSASAASRQSQGGPLLSREPGLATFKETWHLMSGPVVVLFGVGFAVALARSARRRELTHSAWLGVGAIAWLLIDAVLAQGRFATGAPRYLLPGVALAAVVGGVFVADAVRALRQRVPSVHVATACAALGCLALAATFIPRAVMAGKQVHGGSAAAEASVHLRSALPAAVRLAGGREAILACGSLTTDNLQIPLVAWTLDVPVGSLGYIPTGQGVVLQEMLQPRVAVPLQQNYRYVGSNGPSDARWSVLSTC